MSKNEQKIIAAKITIEQIDPETLALYYEVADKDEQGDPIYRLKEEYQKKGIGTLLRGLLP